MKKNRFGLRRAIPAPVKRAIRQRCGFGCVICGSAFFQYEHVDPTYEDARAHDAERITLLCGAHHDLVTRGLLSKDAVQRAAVNPRCKIDGFSFGPLDVGLAHPEIVCGTLVCRGVRSLISVHGKSILSVAPPETAGAPYQISAFLFDDTGRELLRIENNEILSRAENWDVEIVGNRLTVRNGPGEIALVLRTEPPDRLVVERMDMHFDGAQIRARENEDITVSTTWGPGFRATRTEIHGGQVGVDISRDGIAIGVGFESMAFDEIGARFAPNPRLLEFAIRREMNLVRRR